MRVSGGFLLLVVVGLVSSCGKSTPATADSAAVTSTKPVGGLDKDVARSEIARADSAWIRLMMAKNVDSLMTFYTPDIVSMSEGTKAVHGTSDVRAAYTRAVKFNMRDASLLNQTIEFSDDGSLAYDYGTFTATYDGRNGKPAKWTGDFINVWKKVGGRWLMAAEISNSNTGM